MLINVYTIQLCHSLAIGILFVINGIFIISNYATYIVPVLLLYIMALDIQLEMTV